MSARKVQPPIPDRKSRRIALEALDRFLSGKTTLDTLADTLFNTQEESEDLVPGYVSSDIFDLAETAGLESKVGDLDRNIWNHLWRQRLLLASDAVAVPTIRKFWGVPQMLATTALVLLGSSALVLLYLAKTQGGWWTWGLALLNVGCMATTYLITDRVDRFGNAKTAELAPSPMCAPFANFAELLAVRRSVPNFRKRPYPHKTRSVEPREKPPPKQALWKRGLGFMIFAAIIAVCLLFYYYFWFFFLLQALFPVKIATVSYRLPGEFAHRRDGTDEEDEFALPRGRAEDLQNVADYDDRGGARPRDFD